MNKNLSKHWTKEILVLVSKATGEAYCRVPYECFNADQRVFNGDPMVLAILRPKIYIGWQKLLSWRLMDFMGFRMIMKWWFSTSNLE